MRLALDATSLLGPRTGVGAFTHEILTRLAARPGVEVTAFAVTWRGRKSFAAALPPGAVATMRPMAARPLRRLWSRADTPPIEWWTGPVDVVHGPNFVVPPARRAAGVVTVHDLTPLLYPEWCTRDTLAYPALVRRAIGRGAWIHTVSEYVADEVRDAFDIEPDRVVAIANGTTPLVDADPAEGAALAGGARYVLGLGTVEPRKDFPNLVAAFDVVAGDDTDLRLVIAGPAGWGAEALDAAIGRARHRDRIVRLGWVDDRRRAALLRGASVFAFPSRYEGFGLPPLEAMAAGTPVVASRAGAIPATVGDAAILVPPGDRDALAGALAEALDPDRAGELVARGAERVPAFSWDRTTAALVQLYERVRAGERLA